MKVVTEEKYIPAKTYITTKYIASDGKEFQNEDDCLKHERYLEINEHPVFKSKIETVGIFDDEHRGCLYYLRNEEDYDFLINHSGFSQGDYIDSNFKEYGEGWYLFWCENGGDYYDHYCIYNYNAYEKEIEDSWEKYKETIHNLVANKSTIL